MVFQNVNGTKSTTGTTSTSSTTGTRNFPDNKMLQKAAEELKISVEDLKAHLEKTGVAKGKGISNLAITVNQMNMKAFCILNGIDYNSWRSYNVKSGEQFFVINNPAQYVGASTSSKPASKPEPKPTTVATSARAAVAGVVQDSAKTEEAKPAPKADSTEKKGSVDTSKVEAARDTSATKQTSAIDNRKEWGSDYTPDELGVAIYKFADENSKSATKAAFQDLIHQINSKNAADVILKYNNNPENKDESLLNTIMSEYGGDGDGKVRKELVMHIYDALAKQTNADPAHRAKFEAEFDARFAETGFVNTKRMDEMLLRMIATPEIIAQQIEKEVDNNRAAVGKNSFNELIELINEDNITEVMEAYKSLNTGESILEAIADEIGSEPTDRQKAIEHIYDAYAKRVGAPEKVGELFKAELQEQTDSTFPMSTTTLEKYMDYLTATPKEIATEMEALMDDNFIKGATDERDFQVLLNLINADNALEVAIYYDALDTKFGLIGSISREYGDSQQSRKDAINHIFNAIADRTYASDEVRQEFVTELDAQFEKSGFVDPKKMDEIVTNLIEAKDRDEDNVKYEPTYKRDLPGGNSKAETKRRDIVIGARNYLEKVFYNPHIDGRTQKKIPSFRQQLVERIQNDSTLTDTEKKIKIAAARHARVDVSDVNRPLPTMGSKGIVNTPQVKEHKPKGPSNGKVVLVNIGHTGFNANAYDAGAASYYENPVGSNRYVPIEETDVVVPYANDLIEKLRKDGYTVVEFSGTVDAMCKDDTVETLSARYAKRFGSKNAMMISFHCDAGKEGDTGSTIIFNPFDKAHEKLAHCLDSTLNASSQPSVTKGSYNDKGTDCGLYVLRESEIPSALVEIEYLTGTSAARVVSEEFKTKFVNATFAGIENYFNN